MSKSSQRLSAILANRMKKTADGAVPIAIELGVVNSNLSITTDSLQAAIPKSDYMLTGGAQGLRAGDRILVAWCGNDPVVIANVGSSAGGTSPGGGGSSGTVIEGKDGFSPTVTITPITGGTRITITDIDGAKNFDVKNGTTPVKGRDYFTAEEVDAIVQEAVKQAVASLEEKFYTKSQIDTMFTEKVITGEEIQNLVMEVFGDK